MTMLTRVHMWDCTRHELVGAWPSTGTIPFYRMLGLSPLACIRSGTLTCLAEAFDVSKENCYCTLLHQVHKVPHGCGLVGDLLKFLCELLNELFHVFCFMVHGGQH